MPKITIEIERIEWEGDVTYATLGVIGPEEWVSDVFTIPRQEFQAMREAEAYGVINERLVQSYRAVLKRVMVKEQGEE